MFLIDMKNSLKFILNFFYFVNLSDKIIMRKIVIFVLFGLFSIYAENFFYYDFKDIKILKIAVRANYKIYINNKYQGLYTKEYKAILNINKSNIFNFNGILFKLDKILKNGIHTGYKVNNIENIIFSIDKNGVFIEENNIFPLIQGALYFPENLDIEKPYSNNGKAIINIENEDFLLPIKITTLYSGKEKLWGETYESFTSTYSYYDIPEEIKEKIKEAKGIHKLKIYFDNNKGMPVYIEDHFTEEFYLNEKNIKRSGFYLFFYTIVEEMNKDEIIKDLTDDKIIAEKDKDYIKIEKRKEGIALILENLLFKPNTSELLGSEYEKIDKIFEILSKIKNRTFLIIGHTALAGTYEEQMNLSLERAKVVAESLIKKGINPEQILYTGKGATEPVAPNDTEENMRKNRRVEIIILED